MCSFFLSREPFLRTEVPRESLWGHHQARMGSPSGGPNPSRGWGGALHGVWEGDLSILEQWVAGLLQTRPHLQPDSWRCSAAAPQLGLQPFWSRQQGGS